MSAVSIRRPDDVSKQFQDLAQRTLLGPTESDHVCRKSMLHPTLVGFGRSCKL